ncbi:hypothetical protein [Bradyrhizobium sp. LHD-71]|uniref:hypothetical protein n=1 Tax=Bradyrhizobium sp. LHD-71 TaxID=3072141 RepID=UPI00280E615A|nr:hypothetical protein [Bradyrhizobium sp. LHD-71]MDQ8730815.1 hypothetical protein [Bradyrhizobium sp. LHD-71]
MTDPTDARSKAEASLRLAELAKTPRARELFKQLAEEYESRARAEIDPSAAVHAEAAPPLVPAAQLSPTLSSVTVGSAQADAPLTETERWLAGLKATRLDS